MKRAALLVLALAAALVVLPGTAAFACSCAAPPVAEQVDRADLVVEGVVGSPEGGGQVVTYPVTVRDVWKGQVAATVQVRSPRDGASCGLEVEPGREYLVFANERGDAFEARLCGGTTPATPALVAGVEAVAGPATTPAMTPSTPSSTSVPSSTSRPVAAAVAPGAPAPTAGAATDTSTPVLIGLGVLVVVIAAVGGAIVRRRRA